MVGTTETYEVTIKALVGGDNLPDLNPCTDKAGSTTSRAICEDNARTTARLDGFS